MSNVATLFSSFLEKHDLFIECLRRKIKSWFETMSPVPWRKSCKWTSAELFITSGLILTDSKSKLKIPNVDPQCKLRYRDIFTDERLKSETRIIIEGDPGSGKTMLSAKLAYDWSIGDISNAKMVIFLPLKFVEDMTIIEAIEKFYIPKGKGLDRNDIKALLNQTSDEGKTCIVLDGVEEYNDRTREGEPSEIVRVMRKEKLGNCTVVLTSRSDLVQDLPQCPMLRLGQFGEQERDLYIAKIIPDNEEKQHEVKSTIENSAFLLDLCSSPLMFVFIVHNMEVLLQLEAKSHLDRVGPFMQAMVNTLLSQAKPDSAEETKSEVQSARLSEIAFNGLCRGHQQLLWQKDFIDKNVSNMKEFVESGILVVEEDLVTAMWQQENKGNAEKEAVYHVVQIGHDQETPKQIVKGKQSLKEVRDKEAREMEVPLKNVPSQRRSGSQQSKTMREASVSNPHRVSLQVKFLHKVIQEWFAAIDFSFILKDALGGHRHGVLKKHLTLINPADLHYVLRFTSYLCPDSCHLIMELLYKDSKQEDGSVPEYILNCIFLCFAEIDSSEQHTRMDNAVRQVCKTDVTIRGEDSRLLQQAKVSMLMYASNSKVNIRTRC